MPESRTVYSFRAFLQNNNSYLHKTTIHRQNKLITRAFDSPRVLPKRQRSVLIFSRCPLSRCFTFRFPRLNNLQAGATLVFRFRHFRCPSFCLILLPLLSLRISHWLSFFLHVSAFAASRHMFHMSGCLPLGPSFLISLTDPLITLIGSLVISGRLAPAARLAVNFISVTVTLNI